MHNLRRKQTCRVYRLEKDGIGPARHPQSGFQMGINKLSQLWDNLDMDKHIEYVEDYEWFDYLALECNVRLSSNSVRFACLSLDALLQYWTPEFVEACLAEGFAIKTYSIKGKFYVCPGNIQCCYFVAQAQEQQPLIKVA